MVRTQPDHVHPFRSKVKVHNGGVVVTHSPHRSDERILNPDVAFGYAPLMSSNKSHTRAQFFLPPSPLTRMFEPGQEDGLSNDSHVSMHSTKSRSHQRLKCSSSAAAPCRCATAMLPERSTRAEILWGCRSLDRGSRELEIGFERRTFRYGFREIYSCVATFRISYQPKHEAASCSTFSHLKTSQTGDSAGFK
ncbi:hypothetical protein T265_14058, partial [Opisthorchis viverrini]